MKANPVLLAAISTTNYLLSEVITDAAHTLNGVSRMVSRSAGKVPANNATNAAPPAMDAPPADSAPVDDIPFYLKTEA